MMGEETDLCSPLLPERGATCDAQMEVHKLSNLLEVVGLKLEPLHILPWCLSGSVSVAIRGGLREHERT